MPATSTKVKSASDSTGYSIEISQRFHSIQQKKPKQAPPKTSPASVSFEEEPEVTTTYEDELSWCIKELQTLLDQKGKASEKKGNIGCCERLEYFAQFEGTDGEETNGNEKHAW
ncbi:unnamed protein product [Notodromas monacha]|uniref:Uncharacterized protein n=1 Tax=Notodromas monacha TaxID=399045 RepID=A0A7R9BGP8_9CRUS|nr:unnamed protein product [Notodromas monacha]CAG0915135.1 unnamed protein product [Notodromas monacha]